MISKRSKRSKERYQSTIAYMVKKLYHAEDRNLNGY